MTTTYRLNMRGITNPSGKRRAVDYDPKDKGTHTQRRQSGIPADSLWQISTKDGVLMQCPPLYKNETVCNSLAAAKIAARKISDNMHCLPFGYADLEINKIQCRRRKERRVGVANRRQQNIAPDADGFIPIPERPAGWQAHKVYDVKTPAIPMDGNGVTDSE
ncbi:MAG: hypothetical protein ACR2PR_06810 [Pseudohongiellaceae bacterium]